MFLSRFTINPARRGARKLLGSPHAMHAAVLCAFPPPEESVAAPSRVLWRVDTAGHSAQLLVLSPESPDFTHLVEQAGWPTADREPWQVRVYDGLLDRIATDQTWAFRLRANPTKTDPRTHQRFAHVTAGQQRDWLLRRAEAHGFEIRTHDGEPSVVVADRERRVFQRGDTSVTLVTVRYDGLLKVLDAELFRTTLVAGIGPAKGYGCGLLTVVQPS